MSFYFSAVVVVKWSSCSPSTPTVQVRIPPKSTVAKLFENNENKQKRAGHGPFKNHFIYFYHLVQSISQLETILDDLKCLFNWTTPASFSNK